ncbi:family 43 glycosylhydrolase [Pseudescherichia sp.]|uniref:glycoside hydrolase family 43 protein n=1 Tax=Pseudescherichia sp. TaxID=2055881 RepID=UPI0028AA11C4|nr:family 43 glycosylhydrolase [Pseudescherichia sp.]
MSQNTYQNPILCADYSDPDIVRVGDDFFMVSSSFNHMPALPVLHSTDLVSWRIINHVFASLDLAGYDTVQPGKGVWAPSLRWHNDRLWVFFSTPDEGIFMCHTQDPWGAWSKPHCVQPAKGWIDPCPFWDEEGSAWLVHAFAHSRSGIKHKLQLFSMKPDGTALQGEGQIIYDGSCDLPTLEGPKVYKRNGLYYIFAPAGGVETGWQTVLRAPEMTGPWEARNVLFQGETAVNGPHQGGWVELKNGECWFVHFQDAHLYGRIVHLQPMSWDEDGWPHIGEPFGGAGAGQPVLRWQKPGGLPAVTPYAPQTSDDFATGRPGLQWQWQANPQPNWLIPATQGLHLRCILLPEFAGQRTLYAAPQLLLQKFPAFTFTARTRATLAAAEPESCGGLIIYGERYAALVIVRRQQCHQLCYVHGWMSDAGVIREQCQALHMLSSATCELQVSVGEGGVSQFAWREDGGAWQQVPRTFAAGKGKWVGAKVGIFAAATADAQDPGECRFEDFVLEVR